MATNEMFASLSVNDSTPDQAINHVNNAEVLDIPPESYKEMKDELEPQVNLLKSIPDEVAPITRKIATENPEVGKVMQPDLSTLDKIERGWNRLKERVTTGNDLLDQQRELVNKKMSNGGVLEAGDEEQLVNLNAQVADVFKETEADNLGIDVAQGVYDFGKTYTDNLGLLAATTAAGALGTGALAALIPLPGTSVIGAATGGIASGFSTALFVVPAVDQYQKMVPQVYNDLTYSADDAGEPLNISHDRKMMIARGSAVLSAAAAGLAGKAFAKLPVMKKLLSGPSSVKYMVKNPALMAKLEMIGGIVNQTVGEGFEEGVEELTQIVSSNLGKIDESEASFSNGLDNIIETLKKSDTWKNVGKATVVGGLTGGTISTAFSLPGYNSVRDNYVQLQQESQKNQATLRNQNEILTTATALNDVKLKQTPTQMKNWLQQVFGGHDNVWFTVEDLRQLSTDAEKGERLRRVIESSPEVVQLLEKTDSPIQMSKAQVVELAMDIPEITDRVRLTPEQASALEIRERSKKYTEDMSAAQRVKAKLSETLGLVDDAETAARVEQEAANLADEVPFFDNVDDYASYSPMNEEVDGVFTAKQAKDFNESHLNARMNFIKAIDKDVNKRYDKYEDLDYQERTEEDIQKEINSLHKERTIIENFQKPVDKNANVNYHKKPGFSANAIDPKYLSEAQKIMYFDNNGIMSSVKKNMKQRKVFVEGGISLEEAAALNGVESGEKLLEILANTPTEKQIRERIKKDSFAEIKKREEFRAKEESGRRDARDVAITTMTNVHLKEHEFMRTHEWGTLKRGAIKIASALRLKKSTELFQEITNEAKITIDNTTLKELSATRFKVGEKRTSKKAIVDFNDGKIESAIANKEKAALNSELVKHAINAAEKTQANLKFLKNIFTNDSKIQALKDAGYWNAINDLCSHFNVEGARTDFKERDAFYNWVVEQEKNGGYIPTIPTRLASTKVDMKDLTVQEVQQLSDLVRTMYAKANKKNEIRDTVNAYKEARTLDTAREDFQISAEANPRYSDKKGEEEIIDDVNTEMFDKMYRNASSMSTVFTNIKNVAMRFDNNQLNGMFQRTFIQPLTKAYEARGREYIEMKKEQKRIENHYYKGDFNKLLETRLDIPELKGFIGLGDGAGSIRKIDLMKLLAYQGDPDARERTKNFKNKQGISLTPEQLSAVFDKHLDENDAAFVNDYFIKSFKRFEKASFELQKRSTGIDPDMVQGVKYVHRGIVYEGGYQPLNYRPLSDAERANKVYQRTVNESLIDEDAYTFKAMRAAEMTNQDRMKTRTGSSRALDISFENHYTNLDEIMHDLHFREVGEQTLKLIRDPVIAKSIKSVVGRNQYNFAVDSIRDTVSRRNEFKSEAHMNEQHKILGAINKLSTLHAMKTIAFNIYSAARQTTSLGYLSLRGGPKTALYVSKALKNLLNNRGNFEAEFELYSKVNPDLLMEQNNIKDDFLSTVMEDLPFGVEFSKKYKKLGTAKTRFNQYKKNLTQKSFYMLQYMDNINRLVATKALTDQFLAGDLKGYDIDKVNSMSAADKKVALENAIKQVTDLSLTSKTRMDLSSIEKNPYLKLITAYITDRRSNFNTIINSLEQTYYDMKGGNHRKGVEQLILLAVVTGAITSYQDWLSDDEEGLFDQLEKLGDAETIGQFASSSLGVFTSLPVVDELMSSTPVLDSVKYAYESSNGKSGQIRPVSTPILAVLTDITMGLKAANKYLEKDKELSKSQRKALITNVGFIVGGAPTNQLNRVIDMLTESGKTSAKGEDWFDTIKDFNETVEKYVKNFKDDPDKKEFIEDLKEQQSQLPQFDGKVTDFIPENTKEDLKLSLSEGNWRAFNEKTQAFGIYQYTPEKWEEMMIMYPDLTLTEAGRLDKDGTQQEKAFEREIQETTKTFMAYGLEVSKPAILGAHLFGTDAMMTIETTSDDEKLSTILTKEEMSNPLLADFKTVGDVRKYLSKQVRRS